MNQKLPKAGLTFLAFFLFAFSTFVASAQPGYQPSAGNVAEREAFRERKFGMFVHWGLYSQLANGEWVMYYEKIPHKTYENLAQTFAPHRFNAEEMVLTAKRAGMKYITITSKHHDGFCLWDTKLTDYNSVKAPGAKRDLIKEVAEACKKHDIKLCLYYSLLDWHHTDYTTKGQHFAQKVKLGNGTYAPIMGAKPDGDFNRYVDYMCGQLKELLTNYGPIGTIWFDGQWEAMDANWQLAKIYKTIHDAQPNCLIGNNHHRAVNPGEDFQMFEKDLPGANSHGWVDHSASISELPLEVCETTNDSWGYKITDTRFKSAKAMIQLLVKSAAHDANLLMNVGPDGSGVIPSAAADSLAKVGEWLATNGQSIYSTRGGITRSWGGTTQKSNKLFVHVLKAEDEVIFIPLNNKKKVKTALVFNKSVPVSYRQDNTGLYLNLPKERDPIDTILELTLQ